MCHAAECQSERREAEARMPLPNPGEIRQDLFGRKAGLQVQMHPRRLIVQSVNLDGPVRGTGTDVAFDLFETPARNAQVGTGDRRRVDGDQEVSFGRVDRVVVPPRLEVVEPIHRRESGSRSPRHPDARPSRRFIHVSVADGVVELRAAGREEVVIGDGIVSPEQPRIAHWRSR